MYRLFYLLVFSLLVLLSNAQLYFRHLKVKDGLSQSSVNFVIKDKKGFYWIGTQYGLNRFDGKNFQTFYTANTPQLADNFLTKVVEDCFGNLWFGTRNNVCRYNPETEKFTSIVLDTLNKLVKGHNDIHDLFTDNQNNILFNSLGSLYLIPKNELNALQPKVINAFQTVEKIGLTSYNNGVLYALYKDTLFKHKYVNTNYKRISFTKQAILNEVNPKLFVSYGNSHLFLTTTKIFQLQNDTLKELLKNVFSNTTINCINFLNNHYYIGTDNGLYEYTNDFKFVYLHQVHLQNVFSLSENKVLSVSQTSDNHLWIGSSNAGVSVSNLATPFHIIKPDVNTPYIPISCCFKNDTTLLIGTANGIDCFSNLNQKWEYRTTFFNKNKVTSLYCVGDTLFIGTTNGLFYNYRSSFKKINLKNEPNIIFDITQDKKQNLVISSVLGVYILKTKTFELVANFNRSTVDKANQSTLKSNYVFNTHIDSLNNYYVNTTKSSYMFGGNFNFKNDLFLNYNYKSLSEIMITKVISKTPDIVWCGSLGGGIYKLEKNKISFFNQKNGLINDVIASMEQDANFNIWASTNYGIACITPNHKILSFTNELNLESPEFINNGSCKKANELFFCSNSGIIHFNPQTVLSSNLTEKLYLNNTSVIKNYTDTLRNDSLLELNYTDKILAMNFCVPSYHYYSNIKLSYRLKDFDDTWHTFENGKGFSFMNIPSGQYALEVKAELSTLNWTQQSTYSLLVQPPFWKRTGFIIFVVLSFITLISLIVWYLSRIKLKKQLAALQLQQAIHEEKERISRDLHDNIGSQISTLITGLDKITITQKTDNAERLSDYARQTLSELRETIWALNTESVDLTTLQQKLEELIFDFRTNYESVTIQFTCTWNENKKLNPEQSLTLFRIIQEAISNALKHAQCSEISIKVNLNQKQLTTIITDNGKGFDTTTRKKGHYGLDNMKVRAQQAAIEYKISSEPQKGTEISLILTTE
jgi:signal transduction histidine kinase/ligand-binding sensor domain-containing protein